MCSDSWVVKNVIKDLGILVIAVLNMVFYAAVLLFTVVIVPVNAHPYFGSGWNFVYMLAYCGFAYSIAGIAGIILLLKHYKSLYALAVIGWISEIVFFSVLSSFSYTNVFGESGDIIGRIWNMSYLLPFLSVIALKVISTSYFATKTVRRTFGW